MSPDATTPRGGPLLRRTPRVLRFFLPLVAALLVTMPLEARAQEARLTPGSRVADSLAAGDTATYTVEAGAEYLVRGAVEQTSVDAAVRIVGPDGNQVARTQGTERGRDRIELQTEQAGVHRLELISAEDEAGEYVITLDRLEALSSDPSELADQLLSAWDRDDEPGVAAAVWRDGETLYTRAYGMADLTHDVPFQVNTPTNIGSTSKQFTGFAVMLLVDRGEIELDADVREYLPELPGFEETVTVRHLLTHTTGYREFVNLAIMAGLRIEHADYVDREWLVDVVQRQPALQNEPGTEFNYNNTAFGLAAQIVERVSGQSFDVFMEENVFEPLGMDDTYVRMTPEHIIPGRSVGYRPAPDGTFREATDLWAAVGAGGIYSTVSDLETWAENYRRAQVGHPESIREMTTSYVLANGDSTGYGYGIFIDDHRGLRHLSHGGNDVAHTSAFHYFPEIDAGLTLQTNHGGHRPGFADQLLDAFFGDAMEPEEEGEAAAPDSAFDPAAYDPEDFDELAGRYVLDDAPQVAVTLSRRGDSLFVRVTGQPRLPLRPTSPSTFDVTSVDAEITIHRNEDGEVEALTLEQQGQTQRATRQEGEGPEAWEPTEEELREFEGRYFSREIETFYDLEVVDGVLQLSQRRMGTDDLEPGERDTFSGAGFELSFERDRNGQIISVYVSNGRTRDVRFRRLR